MELSLDNVLSDNLLDMDDSLNDNLLGSNLSLDQPLDDNSWFLLFNGNLDLNADLFQDDLSMDNSLLQSFVVMDNLDLDVSDKLSFDDLQFLVLNLLLLDQFSDLLSDLFDDNLDLFHSDDEFVDNDLLNLSDSQFLNSDSDLS